MAGVGLYIAVPEDLTPTILRDGYRCTRRRRIPAHRNRTAALAAYRRYQANRTPCLLEVISLPHGVNQSPHKDGIKLETQHLPAQHLVRTTSHSPARTGYPGVASVPTYHPPQPSIPPPMSPSIFGHVPTSSRTTPSGTTAWKIVYHATSLSNANNIIAQGRFRPGNHGFIGPGIYFSDDKEKAFRYCQCRTGTGPRVALQCRVNVGRVKMVRRNMRCDRSVLQAEGCDSFEEMDRDSIMIPDDTYGQIDMPSVHIHY